MNQVETQYRRSGPPTDAEAVYAVMLASVRRLAPPDPYSQEVVDTWMDGRSVEDYRDDCASGEIWIAELSGEVVGFSQGTPPGEVKRLFVKEAAIGLGIGTELMKRALSDARANGETEVIIDATLNAASFYEGWGGFHRIGTGGVFPGREGLPPIEIVHMTQSF